LFEIQICFRKANSITNITVNQVTNKGKKVKLSLCLTKYRAMKLSRA